LRNQTPFPKQDTYNGGQQSALASVCRGCSAAGFVSGSCSAPIVKSSAAECTIHSCHWTAVFSPSCTSHPCTETLTVVVHVAGALGLPTQDLGTAADDSTATCGFVAGACITINIDADRARQTDRQVAGGAGETELRPRNSHNTAGLPQHKYVRYHNTLGGHNGMHAAILISCECFH
jgi:hypothetical protein